MRGGYCKCRRTLVSGTQPLYNLAPETVSYLIKSCAVIWSKHLKFYPASKFISKITIVKMPCYCLNSSCFFYPNALSYHSIPLSSMSRPRTDSRTRAGLFTSLIYTTAGSDSTTFKCLARPTTLAIRIRPL